MVICTRFEGYKTAQEAAEFVHRLERSWGPYSSVWNPSAFGYDVRELEYVKTPYENWRIQVKTGWYKGFWTCGPLLYSPSLDKYFCSSDKDIIEEVINSYYPQCKLEDKEKWIEIKKNQEQRELEESANKLAKEIRQEKLDSNPVLRALAGVQLLSAVGCLVSVFWLPMALVSYNWDNVKPSAVAGLSVAGIVLSTKLTNSIEKKIK